MESCTRCNWSGPAGLATCPRCGLSFSAGVEKTIVQTGARPVLLLKLLGGELPPAEWEIDGVEVGIGRLDDSQITLPHRSVSRHHARIVPTPNGYEVEDLGSTNGTWLNDKALSDRVALADGDSLMVGDIPLVVELIQPQRQTEPEIFDVPQLPAPARTPEAPAGGGPSTVFYELDAALAAAGPAEPPPPLQPAQRPADYQRVPATPAPAVEPVWPPQPASPPADYQRTPSTPAPKPAEPQLTPSAAAPSAAEPTWPPQPAQPPVDYQRTVTPAPPLTAAKPPADYLRTPAPGQGPPAPPLTVAKPPADYQRTPPPGQPPPVEIEVPRAWDDTPSTRYDLPRTSDVGGGRAAAGDNDEHPTIIAGVPTQQFQSAPAASPSPANQVGSAPPPVVQTPAWYDPQPAPPRDAAPAVQTPAWYDPQPAAPERKPAPYDPVPTPAPHLQPLAPQSPLAPPAPTPQPGSPPTSRPASAAPPAVDAELTAANMIDLAERLATALRLLKGDIALAMWLFEHAGGPPAAQEFVGLARRLEADPTNPQDLQDLVDFAPTAARLLEAALLLINVLASLDPVGGVDNQPEADAADLQPVARS